jgi:hypothetical protein
LLLPAGAKTTTGSPSSKRGSPDAAAAGGNSSQRNGKGKKEGKGKKALGRVAAGSGDAILSLLYQPNVSATAVHTASLAAHSAASAAGMRLAPASLSPLLGRAQLILETNASTFHIPLYAYVRLIMTHLIYILIRSSTYM